MAIKASGPISFSDIANEFGTSPNRNLGAYLVSQTVGEISNLPLDTGIPQSGIVSFSNFYSKKLNVVVNCGSGTRINARTLYDNNTVGIVTTIGGYRIRPTSSSGSKVWIHVTGTITPNFAAGQLYCALLTGNWDGNTDLILDIGPSGYVRGIGGNGGGGGGAGGGRPNPAENGQNGFPGTSAIGVSYTPITINNRGTVFPGTGGGGGGAGGWRGVTYPLYVGGGGGGGGRPFGSGGARGPGGTGGTRRPGQSATEFNNGLGGQGGYSNALMAGAPTPPGSVGREIFGGDGGTAPNAGGNSWIPEGLPPGEYSGSPDGISASLKSGGSPGPSGFAFVISGSSTTVTTSGPIGDIIYNTNPS